MRWIALALLFASCSDPSLAGSVNDAVGGAGGSVGAGGTAGEGIDAAAQDTGSQEAAVEAAQEVPAPSCLIPASMVSGTGAGIWTSLKPGSATQCPTMTINVQIINGVYYNTGWTMTNYMIYPADNSPGQCTAVFTYSAMSTQCGTETLRVTLMIPSQ